MSTFGERLAAAKSKTVPYADVPVTLDDESVETFRFHRLTGRAWSEITARNPQRLDAMIDLKYGYNYQGACEDAALATGAHLDGDIETKLSKEEWIDLFQTISGSEYTAIIDAIWALNEWNPAQRLEQLKKKSAAATASVVKSPSRSKSGAPRKSSTAG